MSGKSFRNNWELDSNKYGVTITNAHHEVHDGCAYVASSFQSGVSIGAPKGWFFRTPAIGSVHGLFGISSSRAGILDFYEVGIA